MEGSQSRSVVKDVVTRDDTAQRGVRERGERHVLSFEMKAEGRQETKREDAHLSRFL